MPKMKTRKAVAKRVKVTGSGKLKIWSAYTSHQSHHKSQKQKRHLRKASVMKDSDFKRIKFCINR